MQLTKIIFSTLLILMMVACSTAPLNYKIDPEIKNINQFVDPSSMIALSVIDNRALTTNQQSSLISGPENEADVIKSKLIEILKQNNFKIISNLLLADIALELHIEQFDVNIESDLFKSKIKVESQLSLQAKKNGASFNKLFKMNRSQELANPVNSNEVTGIVNQLLSKQLSTIWSDPGFIKLSNS